MKHQLITLTLIALTVSTFSCKRDASSPEGEAGFTASIEQPSTRTVLTEDLRVNWEDTDELMLNGSLYLVTPWPDNATKADLTLIEGAEPVAPFTAIYPTACYKEGKFVLDSVMTHAPGKLDNIPMWATDVRKSLGFRNIFSLLQIAVPGDQTVKRVRVSSDNFMNGEFTVVSDCAVMADGEASNKATTLFCSATPADTLFYIPVPAGDYTGKSLKIEILDGKDRKESLTAYSTASIIMEPNVIYPMLFDPRADFAVSEEKITTKEEIL